MIKNPEEFYQQLDNLYATGHADQVESFLNKTLDECRHTDARTIVIAAANELGAYYRGINHYDESIRAFQESRDAIEDLIGHDSVEYATTLINIAGTFRYMKAYEKSLAQYEAARKIYEKLTGLDSYYIATIENNISLIFIDQQQFTKALFHIKKALDIIRLYPDRKEEEAITLLNMGQSEWSLGDNEAAQKHIEESLTIYRDLPEKGVHYAALLDFLGVLAMEQADYDKAVDYFTEARDFTYQIFGENEDYRIACDHIAAAKAQANQKADSAHSVESHGIGLSLCRAYYEEVGRPMLTQLFPEESSRIAVGLAGDGSECYGFDDDYSQDHDWGPSFCLWLTDEDYAAFGKKLQQAYDSLPGEFQGYPERKVVPGGEDRVGVLRISDFYRRFIGLDRAPETIAEWNSIPEWLLAKATNGAVFTDPLGRFSQIRQALLAYYPEDIRLKKISVRAAEMAQSGQYNYPRCLKRGEHVAASIALSKFMEAACSMGYLLNRRYTPFYKWAHHGLQYVPILPQLYAQLEQLSQANGTDKVALIEAICTDIRDEWRRQDIIDGTDDFLINYSAKIIEKIHDPHLKSLHILQEY